MLVKICGLTRERDVLAAVEAGADFCGFVVASPKSRRNLDLASAVELASKVAPAKPVLVTAETQGDHLAALVASAEPAALQIPAAAGSVVFAALKARFPETSIFASLRPEAWDARPAHADVYVLDALEGGYGGTGATLEWSEVAALAAPPKPVLLAGGLTPENVGEAVAKARPGGVDVSSGVETDGVKDPDRIRAFVREAKRAAVRP